MSRLTFTMMTLLISSLAWGAPKYTGTFEIKQGGMHKADIAGQISLTFDGDNLSSVAIKTNDPVVGKTDFVSSEQAVFSNSTSTPPQMAVIYKLKGTPHKWYYTFVTTTADQGKTFTGTIYKGTASIDDLKRALNDGKMSDYKKLGSGKFKAATALE